jgi:hypothetical protein
MANPEHREILSRGSEAWNAWRIENPSVQPDLSNADLSMATARRGAASRALLMGGLGGDVRDLRGMNLSFANLSGANLNGQVLNGANLEGADLTGADLSHAHLVDVNLRSARLNGCLVYGISTWNVDLTHAGQTNIVITNSSESTITVDNLDVAQFIYLIINNKKIRDVIDTITSKVVLILGRFTPERKSVLDAIREALRQRGYLPILFDFDKPDSRDITETVSTLAHLARFIIADITDAKSIPQELQLVVPDLPSVPVQPILLATSSEYGMFEHFKRYPWVLSPFLYEDLQHCLNGLSDKIISPCEIRHRVMKTDG